MTLNKPVLIFTGRKAEHNERALTFVRKVLKTEDWKHFYEDDEITEAAAADFSPALVISLLNQRIFKKELLRYPTVNFHPAPPRYPGRGAASFAIFNGDENFGATAHWVDSNKVDCGPIWQTKEFPISKDVTCEHLFFQAEEAAVTLFCEFLERFSKGETLRPNPELKWTGTSVSKKQFQEWLVLDPAKPEEFARKLKAAYHPEFPGPFLQAHGVRFAAVKDDVYDGKQKKWKIKS